MSGRNGTARTDTEDDDLDVEDPHNEPKAPTTPRKPAAQVHSPRLVQLAEECGISKREIETMSTADLRDEVKFQRELALMERRAEAARPTKPAAPTPRPEPEFDLGEIDDPDKPGHKRKMTEEDLDPIGRSFLQHLKKLQTQYQDLENKHGELTKREEQRRQDALGDMADSIFDSIGKEYSHIIGVGGRQELVGTPFWKRRNAAIGAAGVDWNKDSIPTARKKIAAAIEELYVVEEPETEEEHADYDTAPRARRPVKPVRRVGDDDDEDEPKPRRRRQVEEWEAAATPRPTSRQGAGEPKGVKRADKAAAAKLRKMGFETSSRRPSELENELPD